MKKIALFLIIPFVLSLNANDLFQSELVSFTAQKYRVDYNTQTQENKDKLKKDYETTLKLVSAVSSEIKDDVDLKIATNLTALNIWSQKYAQNLKISDETLRELYIKEKPKSVPTYNLYNILVNDEKKAKDIFTKLEKTSKDVRLKEFKKQVGANSQDFSTIKKEGNIGWIEVQKLDKNIQENIKDKNINDLILVKVENIGWQIILIDDFKPIRDVSFDESKEFLTNLIKQQELIKKIDSLLIK
jgi:parvulin-like peptidyl-prolyl isomerase